MKCVVPSQNVKILAKALHSMGKIGEDLFIEPHGHHLIFRTVNMAESAYVSFSFGSSFFSSFSFTDDDDEETLRCKIAMKSLLVVFKSQHGDRLIDWCQIRLDSNGTKVIFQLRYSYGCTKTHFLPIIESETLQANYSKDDCPNHLSASPKLLSLAVKNFRTTEDEVTLSVMTQKLTLKNHLENNLDSKKALKTEISMYPAEFEAYNIVSQTAVTFCLKELRAVVFFAEFTGLPIQLYLFTPGRPVVFVINNDNVYEANYVVATLSEGGTSQTSSQTSECSVATSSKGLPDQKKRTCHEMDDFEMNNFVIPQTSLNNNGPLNTSSGVLLNEDNPLNFANKSVCLNNTAVNSQHTLCSDLSKNGNITQPVVKSVFGRCFNSTFKKQTLPGYEKVLAYDSDGMEDSD